MKTKNRLQSSLLLLIICLSISFTIGCRKDKIPTVTTRPVSNILGTRAYGGGDITSNGGTGAIESGLCWSTSPTPTITDAKTTDALGGLLLGDFTSEITGLTLNTTYYVRAYSTNSVGTGYGETVSFTTVDSLWIDDDYQGGRIVYLLQPGEAGYDANTPHGLIVAPSDQSASLAWWNGSYTTTGAMGTAYGTGNSNSNTIIANQGVGNYAAKICEDLVLNGYSDWYLPSKVELNLLFEYGVLLGHFLDSDYWSSSEIDNDEVWIQDFFDGTTKQKLKDSNCAVRACRNF